MASITQSVPNYTSGISQQPDHFKNPGQVSEALNVVPEIQTGLVKRPGSQFIKTLLADQHVTWFHYYRDQTEQYLGQIRREINPNDTSYNPEVKMWNIKTGETKSVTKDASVAAEIDSYLRHYDDESLQFLTINDYTYITNRTKKVEMDTTTNSTLRPDTHAAYIELKKTANARQYSLDLNAATNIGDSAEVTTVTSVTKVKHKEVYPNHQVYNKTGGIMMRYANNGTNNYPGASSNLSFNTSNEYTGGGPFHTRHWKDWSGDGSGAWAYADRHEGTCTDIGTKVFSLGTTSDIHGNTKVTVYKADGTELNTEALLAKRANLVFRWTTKGVSGTTPDAGTTLQGRDYVCKYEYDIELLHGGEYWKEGDYIKFRFGDPYGGGTGGPSAFIDNTYYLEIVDVEEQKIKAKISTEGDGLIRPEPTPFNADMAVSSGSILGGMKTAIGSLLGTADATVEQIGNGLYLNSANAFNVSTAETDLVNIMTDEINDIGKLPSQCKHGYIVKVANSDAEEDDYYMRFNGNNDGDGPGSWQECAEPGIPNQFKKSTMPLQLVRTTGGNFEIKQVDWPKREVGDENTNPIPSFVDNKINKVLFWRNRICLLSTTNVIASQPGDDNITLPNFWGKTALTVSPQDAIDLSASSDNPAFLYEGMETVQGLLLFSENQQFLLTAEAEVLNPETAKLTGISDYNFNINNPVVSLGTTVGFLDNAGANSRFFEMTSIQRGLEPEILEQSVVVPNLLPKNINLITSSRENTYVLFAVAGTDTVYGYRYFNSGEKRLQSAWFKWTLHDNIKYHTIIDDTYYVVLGENNLVRFDLKKEDTAAYINAYPIHLDNYVLIDKSNFSYDQDTNKTTFSLTGYGFDPNKSVYIIDGTPDTDDFGRYGEVTVSSSIATVTGDWETAEHDLYVGYNFDMQIKLPTIYATGGKGGKSSDINASLIIHRLKLYLGSSGVYETTIERKGKPDYTELIESSLQDAYLSNSTPWVPDKVHTLPTYERNNNLTVSLKSTHPSPATLLGMSWEGDYSTKFYKRV